MTQTAHRGGAVRRPRAPGSPRRPLPATPRRSNVHRRSAVALARPAAVTQTVLGIEHAGRFHEPTECLGGSEVIAVLALDQLRANGFRVVLACPSDTALTRVAAARGIGVRPCEFLALHRSKDIRIVLRHLLSFVAVGRALTRVCREDRVDVVHAFSVIAALYALIPAMFVRVPFVVHVQDAQPPRPLRRAALRLLGRRATRLICVSEAVADMLREIGVQAEKLVVVHNGVEGRFLEQRAPRSVGFDGPGPRIGLFAHIIPWKGHEVFLDAATLLLRRFPSARFYLVGGRLAGVSEEYVDSLRARSAAPPLAGRVELTGACSDVVPWMAAMDVIVHTSVAPEAFGLVICEAMALGKPVIATDCGAPRELITDGTTGYLAPPGDAAALARTLERVLAQPDPTVGLRAAAACRLRFSPEAFGARLARAYEAVLEDAVPIASA